MLGLLVVMTFLCQSCGESQKSVSSSTVQKVSKPKDIKTVVVLPKEPVKAKQAQAYFGQSSALQKSINQNQGKSSLKIATWYGKTFDGKKTASGEIFKSHKLTAAHRTLPFGTQVKITNPKNNKSVVVKVNDRGPYHKDIEIDVSEKAAKILDIVREGRAAVLLNVL